MSHSFEEIQEHIDGVKLKLPIDIESILYMRPYSNAYTKLKNTASSKLTEREFLYCMLYIRCKEYLSEGSSDVMDKIQNEFERYCKLEKAYKLSTSVESAMAQDDLKYASTKEQTQSDSCKYNFKNIDFVEKPIEILAQEYISSHDIYSETEAEADRTVRHCEETIAKDKKILSEIGVMALPDPQPKQKEYFKDYLGTSFGIWMFLLAFLLCIHCIAWVADLFTDVTWNTWGWVCTVFKYGLYAIPCACVYGSIKCSIDHDKYVEYNEKYDAWHAKRDQLNEEIKECEGSLEKGKEILKRIGEIRRDVLMFNLHKRLQLPIRTLDGWDYNQARQSYFTLMSKLESLKSIPASKERVEKTLDIYQEKMDLFVNKSIPVEVEGAEDLKQTLKCMNAIQIRSDFKPNLLSQSNISQLEESISVFVKTDISDDLDGISAIMKIDTSGFLGHDSELLEKQTNRLEEAFKVLNEKVVKNQAFMMNLKETLAVARLIAYRNIYIGAELMNIVREAAGGGTLVVANDNISDNINSIVNIEGDIVNFSMDAAINDMIGSVFMSMGKVFGETLLNPRLLKSAFDNPRDFKRNLAFTALLSVADAAFRAWDQRNEKIKGLLDHQKQIIKAVEKIEKNYTNSMAMSERCIEIIKSMIKCNDGFMKIYSKLYKQVFENRNTVREISMYDFQNLTIAIGEYRKISNQNL